LAVSRRSARTVCLFSVRLNRRWYLRNSAAFAVRWHRRPFWWEKLASATSVRPPDRCTFKSGARGVLLRGSISATEDRPFRVGWCCKVAHTHTYTWTSSCRVSCFRWLEGASTSRPLVDGRVYIIVDEIGRVYKLFRNYGLGFRHELRKNRTKRAN
jgi:hypothetical protein